MMKYRKLTEDGDYVFGNNAYDYISGDAATAQAIKTKLLLFYGEWFENISIGIPMFQSILGAVSNDNLKNSITLLCSQRIKEIPEVTSISSFSVEYEGRNLHIQIEVITEEGTTITQEVSL